MHDLPSRTLLQQMHAQPKSGEELEVLGKQAARMYLCGGCSLNDAVVETVKQAGLSPEQVKRVVEFANTSAYLKEFEKKGSTDKYIHFEGGPASPGEVLKDLNDGGGGTIFDRGDTHYAAPPVAQPKEKLAERNWWRMEQMSKEAGLATNIARRVKPGVTKGNIRKAAEELGEEVLQSKMGSPLDEYLLAKEATLKSDIAEKVVDIGTRAVKGAATGAREALPQHNIAALKRGLEGDFAGAIGTHAGGKAVWEGLKRRLRGEGAASVAEQAAKEKQKLMLGLGGAGVAAGLGGLALGRSQGAAQAKQASVDFSPTESAFEQLWEVEDKPLPYAEPMSDILDMRDKLASARDQLNSDLGTMEVEFMAINDDLYGQVKQAALEGVPLGHIITAWADVTPGPGYVKAAFARISPKLVSDGVFPSYDAVGGSLEKMASVGMPDHSHPLIQCFAAYCTHLDKMAEARAARDELHAYFEKADHFVKRAAGAIPKSGAGPSS